jgi:thiosulfate/3-mercaptopyruvate sulfurtransferase
MRRIISLLVLFLSALGSVAVGCGSSTVQNPENDFKPAPDWTDERPRSQQALEPQPLDENRTFDDIFLDANEFEQLAERDNEPATVIDGRTEAAYLEGHYPGAFHSGNEKSGYKPFKDPEYNDILPRDVGTLQKEAREMGIDNDRPVVIYATPGSKRAGRLFWALEYLGKGNVYVYTPGYHGLKNNLDFTPRTEAVETKGDFVVRRRSEVLATHEDVEQVAKGEANGVLLDTRRRSEFTGEEVRAPRHGYVPEATFYHWERVFTFPDEKVKDGEARRLEALSDLKSTFREKGLIASDTVLVPYCQTGTRSGYMYAVLRELEDDVDMDYTPQNYDGSWARYARIDGAPVNQNGKEKLNDSN